MNWKRNVSSVGAPIIDGKNIFIQTENGYFVILDKETGSILSSTNILKILKTSKQQTFITGFVMGSEKIYDNLPLLIEKIHYSKEKPENKNIYVKNLYKVFYFNYYLYFKSKIFTISF